MRLLDIDAHGINQEMILIEMPARQRREHAQETERERFQTRHDHSPLPNLRIFGFLGGLWLGGGGCGTVTETGSLALRFALIHVRSTI